MRPRLLRVARIVAIALGALVIGAVAVVTLTLTVPAAARTVVGIGVGRLPAEVTVGRVDGPLRGPLVLHDIRLEQEGTRVEIARAVLDWRPLALVGRTVAVDSLFITGVSGVVAAKVPDASQSEGEDTTAAGPLEVPEFPVQVEVRAFNATVDRLDVEGRGVVRSAELVLSGSLDDFELELNAEGSGAPVEDASVRVRLAGAPDRWTMTATSDFTSGGLPPVRVGVEAAGSLTGAQLDSARIETEQGSAFASAEVTWYPEVTWRLESDADLLDVAPLTPDPASWPGRVSFRARSEGRVGDSGIEATAYVDDLGGTLREEALSGSLAAEIRGRALGLERLDLRWGEMEVRGSGEVGDTADLSFAAYLPDLGQLATGAAGSVDLDGAVSGDPRLPRVAATFEAAGVRMDSLSLAGASGTVDVDLGERDAPLTVDARLYGVASGETVVDSVTLVADGTEGAHVLSLGAWLPDIALRLRASGALDLPRPAGGADVESGTGSGGERAAGADAESGARSGAGRDADIGDGPSWAGRIDSLTIATEAAGSWTLTEPSIVYASADSVSLPRTCLRQGPTGACVSFARDAVGAVLASLDLDGLPLGALPLDLREGSALSGRIDAAAEVSILSDGTLRTTASATTSGQMSMPVGQDTARFDFGGEGLRLGVDSVGGRVLADLLVQPLPAGAPFELSASVAFPGLTSIDVDPELQELEGEARVTSDDVSFVQGFLTGVSRFEGRFALDADVSGTLAAPRVRGTAGFSDGRVTIPEAGVELDAVRFTGRADPDGGIVLEGGARSGEGEVTLEGATPLEPSPDDPARLSLVGERFRAVATPEMQVEIAPDLDIVFDGAQLRVEGELAVPWARVELVEIPPAAVAPSDDVVIVDEEPVTAPEVQASVRVVVGDDVRFSGFGFTSMIEGDIDVSEEPGAPPAMIGELRFIDGRYRAYGQDLVIDPGRVVFSGPVEDARLDVTALRTASDGTEAGLDVRGSVAEPEIELVSDPPMADADVVSYILYGKPLSDGSADEQGRVAGAAATLGANVLTTRLASQVGLDDARIEGSTRDQAELVAGKYLTPSIYVSYGVGLFKPSNTFRVKYLLNSNWALQAESGDANGGDILYQIERGR